MTKTKIKPKRASLVPFTMYPQASSFYAMGNCDASYQLSQASGEEPPTVFSDRGTEVHEVISGKLDRKKTDETVNSEADALLEQQLTGLRAWGGEAATLVEAVREQRLWIRDGLTPIYSGQPDSWVTLKRDVYLSDFKTTWHPLDDIVATNSQIRVYVSLIDEEVKHKLDSITAAIHKPGKLSPPAVFDREAIDAAREWAIDIAVHAVEPGRKKPTKGPWCKYCSGKVLCPLWREELMSLAEMAAAVADDIPDTQLRLIGPKLALAKMVVERLESRLVERVKARPDFFPDWSFEPGTAKRKIDDTIEAYNILVIREKVMTPGEFLLCANLGITHLENRIRQNKTLTTKGATDYLNRVAKKVLTKTEPKDKLVYNPQKLDGTTNQQLTE